MENLKDILKKIYWEQLAEEGITKEDLKMVDLEIGCTPVIPFKGDDPVDAVETMGLGYQVIHPLVSNPVTPEELKVMRYRYLISRKREWF
jgi:hypothetical protein